MSPSVLCPAMGKAKHALPDCCSGKRIKSNASNEAFAPFSHEIKIASYFHEKVISVMVGMQILSSRVSMETGETVCMCTCVCVCVRACVRACVGGRKRCYLQIGNYF